ncbi:MAG: two-component system, OmpR family, sensor kinase [Actinomycetota bacterium]|nr:two-component system, OmpR family, sensor kinase [Actinomycetota bacterium]
MSLRLRLVTGLAALVVVGLLVFGTVTYLSVNRFLLTRLDSQLSDAARALVATDAARLRIPGGGAPDGGPGPGGPGGSSDETSARNAAGPELFVEFVHPDGSVFEPVGATRDPGGLAPQTGPVVAAMTAHPGDRQVRRLTVAPEGGGKSERVAVLPMNGGAIVVTASLKPIRDTLEHLLVVEVAVGLGVLVLTGGLGLALARQATRPLEEIAATADAIAAGDMDRRVPPGRSGSETGRVARALNAMLAQIQDAFTRRDATEARLRTFVADASHELSTPLTSIRGYAELFHRGLQNRPEDLAKALQRIESEATRMGLLVDELLTLASFDAGRPLARDPVDLRSIAHDAAVDLRAVDPTRQVDLDAAHPVIVVGDEARLRQVAANLVSNVRRHTPAGTSVTVRAHQENGVGLLEVADTGPGMTGEQAAKVFDRFYRVDKARSRAVGGAGLGLAIVASIAEAHGGQASVKTREGKGTTFTVAIPLAAPPPDAG